MGVKIYTLPEGKCQGCKAVKKWFERNGVSFEEIDATTHSEKLSEMGYRQVPVIVYDGGHFYGFDVEKLKIVAEAQS